MSHHERVAVAAHLHVLLRRKTGRVTDVEWMAEHLDYALAMTALARQAALEHGAPELADWATKLEQMHHAAAAAPAPKRPLMERLQPEPPGSNAPPEPPDTAEKYVGRLR